MTSGAFLLRAYVSEKMVYLLFRPSPTDTTSQVAFGPTVLEITIYHSSP